MLHDISKSVNDKPIKFASGLAAVSGYEPWPIRTIESMKESIVDGIPILVRFHSGADYPTGSENDDQNLDMESHAVLLVGYDDTEKIFNVVDPWRKDWMGAFNGQYKIPYDAIHTVLVNGTYDKATRMSLPHTEVRFEEINKNRFINLKIGFYRPRGYVLDAKGTSFKNFNITLKVDDIEINRQISGNWTIGEYAALSFRLPDKISGDLKLDFDVKATIQGIRPYPYKDKFHYEFENSITVPRSSQVVKNTQIEMME